MGYLVITNHAEARTKERVGLPKRLTTKNAARALERGITHGDATGSLKRFMDAVYLQHETANNIRIYCGNVYIFYYDTLITVFALPQRYRNLAERLQKEKRNADGKIDTPPGDPGEVY